MLTQNELHRLVSYDPDTGLLTSRVARGPIRPGDTLGTLHHSGYTQCRIHGRIYLSHRLAWLYTYGEWPSRDLDRINRDKLDNRITNLRPATRTENNFNTPARSHNRSGIKGVRKSSKPNRWHARAVLRGKEHSLGIYDTAEEAAAAYQRFAAAHQGEFMYSPTFSSTY